MPKAAIEDQDKQVRLALRTFVTNAETDRGGARYWLKIGLAVLVVQLLYWSLLSPQSQRPNLSEFQRFASVYVAPLAEPTLFSTDSLDDDQWSEKNIFWYDCCDQEYFAFRYDFELDELPEKDLGLIAGFGADNVHIWVNGFELIDDGDLSDRGSYQKWTRGVLRVSRAMLRPGKNTVTAITARHGGGYTDLYPQTLGDYEALKQAGARRSFFVNEYRVVSMILYGLIAMFALLVLPASRNKAFALWLGLLMGALSLRLAYFRWEQTFLSPELFQAWWFVLTALISVSWFNLLDAWQGEGHPWARRVCTIAGSVLGLVMLVLILQNRSEGFETSTILIDVFLALCAVGAALNFSWYIYRKRPNRTLEIAILVLGITAMALDSANKFLPVWWSGGNLNHLLPFLVIALAAAFLARNIRIFESMESFTAELNEKLEQSEAEIRDRYQELREERRARDLAEDRQRILRDMHDGIGNQLTGLLVTSRAGKMSSEELTRGIESCLNDLRLVISSLDNSDESFTVAMTSLRTQLSRQMDAAEIQLSWNMTVDLDPQFDSRTTLNIARIVQEAATNIIRHSSANSAKISVTHGAVGSLQITIEDDGRGICDSLSPEFGHGMGTMAARAKLIGGELTAENSVTGFTVSLVMPAQS